MMAIPFPQIDPVMVHLGPWPVRWYGVAYAVGILGAWAYLAWLIKRFPAYLSPQKLGEIITPLIIGIIVGGRLGFVLFYQTEYYLAHPIDIIKVWQGGMAFHGGLIGAIFGIAWFARQQNLPWLSVTDVMACGTPIGLFLGRLANFINGEHFGRPTEMPWGVIFPHGGPWPRHPSQIYEALTEGLCLLILLGLAWRTSWRQRPGRISGLFLVGYALARIGCELFRTPDGWVNLYFTHVTMGQALSIPMMILGVYLIYDASCRTTQSGH